MPISQNKLMPYSDNPARILENDMQHRRSNRDAPTRKNGSSTRFRPKKFFQKWIMSSTYLKLPGQQHAMYIHPNDSNNHSSRFPVKIRPVSQSHNLKWTISVAIRVTSCGEELIEAVRFFVPTGFLYHNRGKHHNSGDYRFQSDEPVNHTPQKSLSLFWMSVILFLFHSLRP
ncbi:hypothetical protein PCASD_15035 [Puccinia coronata f. sp. avenae]|uniref:Uncharacterized protein n=1 Tax=Puccinia coronata f. sp. avenae TaxID=200324 RepID=A0A2N5TDA9_9BASI|nr:hypothetical protein PCASD_13633 [Puccinia coronata f. sp. avenae]PLW34215.1 hypothetical protein PCASD_15035 [Puccinia coronata f. sp. avenae]